MTGLTDAFIVWLQSLAPGTQVLWQNTAFNAKHRWSYGWIDVCVDGFGESSLASCGVTFVPPHQPKALLEPGNFALPRDMDVHAVAAPKGWFTVEFAVPRGQALTTEQEAALARALTESAGHRRGLASAWSVDAVTAGLQAWCHTHARRDDLRWAWNENWVMPPELQRILDGIGDRKTDTYQIGEGLRVTGPAFDTLLELGMKAGLPRREQKPRHTSPPPNPFDI